VTNKRQLGKYELIERLGRGGIAEVFKAYQPQLDRFVALKLMHPYLADDNEFRERFEREAKYVARLRHTNIVQVYDFDFDKDSESYYMVMELIEGTTLKDYMTRANGEKLSSDEILRITRQGLEALAYAHARGMIHRDIKPANIMIEDGGRVVLTDFGIAKIVTGNQFTASGGMIGTPAYMSPEQGLGESGDERSDIYSIGIVMFHMVTGVLPYDADTPVATILKHLNEPVPDLRKHAPNMPFAVERLILKAMAKDPDDRYQSAEEMLDTVNGILGDSTSRRPRLPLTTMEPEFVVPQQPVNNDTIRLPQTQGESSGKTPSISDTTKTVGPIQVPNDRRGGWLLIGTGGILLGALVATLVTGRFGGIFGGQNTPGATSAAATTGLSVGQESTITATPTWTPTNTITITPSFTATWTPSPTTSPTASLTPSNTPSNTATFTATWTPSLTPTSTYTPTASRTPTPTINFTATFDAATSVARDATATMVQATLDAFFRTQQAQTPTPNLTETARLCVLQYDLLAPIKPDPRDPKETIPTGSTFSKTVEIRNIGNCDWLPGTSLSFRDGEQFSAPRRITMDNTEPVKPGEVARFIFNGRAPTEIGVLTGRWELRTEGNILVQPLVEISYYIRIRRADDR
jgi:serine/threonine protein kinase